jgi:hypothetical protein
MHRRDQYAGCHANRLDRVVGRRTCSVGQNSERLREHGDQPRCSLQERLVGIRAQRRQRFQPGFQRAMFVEFFFLLLRGGTDFVLKRRITHRHEMPRLQIRAARRRPGRTDTMFNHFTRHGTIGKIADCPPAPHHFIKCPRASD